jgi:cyclic-di-GMP-binding biofilm dispersal mediator protein
VPDVALSANLMVVSDLTGRSILVTGATGGLGAPISRRLAEAGAALTLVGRDRARLEALGIDATLVQADLAKAGAAHKVIAQAVEANAGLDGVVVASGAVAFGSAVETPDEALVDVFTINTLAPIRLLRAAAEHLVASAAAGRDPFFATISAVVAEQPVAGMAGYSASKAAVTAFSAAAGRELRRSKVRVLDIRPPHTETGLVDRAVFGEAPRLPQGLSPDAVADRVVAAILGGERDLPSTAFG